MVMPHGLAQVELQQQRGADCVETATGNGVILVRDSADRDGQALAIPAATWTAFTASLTPPGARYTDFG
jgi:hypothetical protein